MDFIQSLPLAMAHFNIIGYGIAFLAALFETTIAFGYIIPGSTIILFMGALAAKGHFDLGALLFLVAIGAIIGDNINFLIGKKYGSKIFKKGFWFVKPAYFKKGERFFKRHGPKSVFIGRFMFGAKETVSLVAGTFGMKRLSFVAWNAFGAAGWSLLWVLSGYFFAQSLDIAKIWLTRAGFLLAVFFIASILFYFVKIALIKKGRDFFSFLSSLGRSIKQAISQNPEVRKFVGRHEVFFGFLKKRLDKNTFYGLPVTFLSLALLYALALFGGIVEDVINADIIVSADVRAANLLAIFRSAELTKIFLWITLLGKWQVVSIFAFSAILILRLLKKKSYVAPLLLSIVGGGAFAFIGKIIFHRARPDVALYLENSFSFPSGHAAIAVAFYGFLAYCLIKNIKKWEYKVNVLFAALIVILLIGFSRLYLGVHYASDVWGGYLAGAIWLIIAISLSEYLLSKEQENRGAYSNVNVKKRFASFAIVAASIGLYAIFSYNYQMPSPMPSRKADKIIINGAMDIFKTDRLKYTETLLGDSREPLNFIIVAKNGQQLISLFNRAGWVLADNVDIFSAYRIAKASFLKKSYPRAPMAPGFWNSEVHNFGFEKAERSNNPRIRHHARFWKTNYFMKNGESVYVGAASFDSGVRWRATHKINPDIDKEREFLFNDLRKTGMITAAEKLQFVDPKPESNFSGDLFFTDGKLYLLFIKSMRKQEMLP